MRFEVHGAEENELESKSKIRPTDLLWLGVLTESESESL